MKRAKTLCTVGLMMLIGLGHQAWAKTKCPTMAGNRWDIPTLFTIKSGKVKSASGLLVSVRLHGASICEVGDGFRIYDGFWTQKGCTSSIIFSQAAQQIIADDATESGGIPVTVTKFTAKVKLKRVAGQVRAFVDLKVKAYAAAGKKRIKITARAVGSEAAPGFALVSGIGGQSPNIGVLVGELLQGR